MMVRESIAVGLDIIYYVILVSIFDAVGCGLTAEQAAEKDEK